MEHWPGHESAQITKDTKGKRKEQRTDPSYWQWPHLENGSIGSATLVWEDGRVRWSTLVDTSHNTRWLPLSKPVKVFPETRPPQVDIHEHSARQRIEKGIQYLRAYFPDADFPGELLSDTLEADARDMRCLEAFDPLLGNMLDIIPSHQVQDEYIVAFPMGELGRELNLSRFSADRSGNMVFNATGPSSSVFETPILQITSAVAPSQWISTPSSALLIRTHTSSSLLRLECSKVTRELDITRSEVGDISIADSRILAFGPDIVVVNRNGNVYKCNAYNGGKAMQLIRAHEVSNDDLFWQLGVTARNDECFLASCKTVRHIDLRSANSVTNMFSLDHPSTIVTSFESPMQDYISRITTTSDVLWLDDRFRKRPLLSFKHYRCFDRTLRVLSANLNRSWISLLTSRRNGLVTLYDVSRGTDSLLHCNTRPSCLPHAAPVSTAYDGHALVAFSSDAKFTHLRLCQRGGVHRQDVRISHSDGDQPGPVQDHVTHHWDADVLALEKQANELRIDFGPAGGRHFTEVNLRDAYKKLFTFSDDTQEDTGQSTLKDTLARLPDVWKAIEGPAGSMLTTFDVISCVENGGMHPSHTNFLAGSNINLEQNFDASICGHPAIQKLSGLAGWHYNIQDTLIPAVDHHFATCAALDDSLKRLDLVSGVEPHEVSVRRETQARERLVLDLTLSKDIYSPWPFVRIHSVFASEGMLDTAARSMDKLYGPPEVEFGYFRPIRKAGADHYADKDQCGRQDSSISSPLGVRLLLAEWELGTDPNDYTYRDPYGVADMDAQPILQYRRPAAPPMTQKKVPSQQPPPVVAAATRPPVVHAGERAPVTFQSQTIQHGFSQKSEPGFHGSSQEPMMSTQVLPGPFGGRPGVGGKRLTKKRLGGF